MRDYREPWLDRKGAAQYWSCSVRTVDYWLKAGMPHERMMFPGGKSAPRILPSEAEPWLVETGRLTRSGASATVGSTEANGAATTSMAPPHDREVGPDGS
jgi:hypothetical protein